MIDAIKISEIETALMQRVVAAAQANDLNGVRMWSQKAEECQQLRLSAAELQSGVERLRSALAHDDVPNDVPAFSRPGPSRAEGAAVRRAWIEQRAATGTRLLRAGSKYQTSTGKSLRLAFANELPSYPNKWWLGLPDEATDIAVLLCNDRRGKVLDIVLAVADLGTNWNALSRSNGQIKFNVKRDGGDLVLLVPGSSPLSLRRWVSNYEVLL